jgi:dTDP-4-amino-4,6-dideoxygalactose transaminase
MPAVSEPMPTTPEPTERGPWRVPLTEVRLPPEAIRAAAEALESGWLSSGPRVAEFEAAFANHAGCAFALATSSGTAAIQLAYAALGIRPGDEVVMPALTFVASANAAVLAGARPVFADVVGADDLTVDPDSVASRISRRTKAIVAMHYGGYPCSPALVDLAHRHGVALIEDAAHAIGAGSEVAGPCGSWGAFGCFSFYANKNMPLGEGGILTSDDPELAKGARLLRSHGMTSGTWERRLEGGAAYDVVVPGFNFRMDESRAALGMSLLPGVESDRRAREARSRRYRQLIQDIPGVEMPFANRPAGERAAYHLASVVLDPSVDRDAVAQAMAAQGVQTSVHYRPAHLFSAYREPRAKRLPRTEDLSSRLLTLPLFPHLEDSQMDYVAQSLRGALTGT